MSLSPVPGKSVSLTPEEVALLGGPSSGRTASLTSATFNLTNTIIGAGVLALPFAFKNCGIVMGAGLLLLTFGAVAYGCTLLLRTASVVAPQHRSYAGMASQSMGHWGTLFTEICLIGTTFGALVSYLMIVADLMAPLVGSWVNDFCSAWAGRTTLISLSLIIVTPLSLLPRLEYLQWTSLAALVSMVYLLGVVVWRGWERLTGRDIWDCEDFGCLDYVKIGHGVFRALPIITTSFCCQMNIFPILSELSCPSYRRATAFVYLSLTICVAAYMFMGGFGYLTFYQKVQGNILINYEVDDEFVKWGRLAVSIVVVFSYPLMCHPCVAAVDGILFHRRGKSHVRRAIEVLIVTVLAYLLSLFFTDISVVLGLTGATSDTALSFVLPAIFYIRLRGDGQFFAIKNITALILLVLGVFLMVISTVVTLIDSLNDDEIADGLCK